MTGILGHRPQRRHPVTRYHPVDVIAFGRPPGLEIPPLDLCSRPVGGRACGDQSVAEITYDGQRAGICGPHHDELLAALDRLGDDS